MVATASNDSQSVALFLNTSGPDRLSSLTNWYSLAYRPVFGGPMANQAQEQLLTALARHLKQQAAQITLGPVPEADGSRDLLISGFQKAGWMAMATPQTGHWHARISHPDFAAFWAERPSRLQQTCARKARKYGVTCAIDTQWTPENWAIYTRIYAQSWKPAEGDPDFLAALARDAGADGSLRLGIAYLEQAPVAAQFWTVDHRRAIIHKLAHLPSAQFASPGTILSAALFRHVIDQDHVQAISFGTGDDAYKADWVDSYEQLWRIRLWNPSSPTAMAGYALARSRQLFRRSEQGIFHD